MWYLLHENDQKRYVKENSKYFVTVFDYTTKTETLCVYFTPQDNDRVLMKTKYPLTYMYAGKEMSASVGEYTFSQNRELVLLSDSAETPRITVRMVKLDPQDWPVTPPPEDIGRAPTLPYNNVVFAAPPPVDPAPPPAQGRKKPKKRRREFHMCA